MKYKLGDKFLVNNIECRIVFINSRGHAYLAPVEDDPNAIPAQVRCLVCAVLDEKGRDDKGKKGVYIVAQECGAV